MSLPPPSDAFNPFEAPRAPLGTSPVLPGEDSDAELTRRQYLSHEASIKSIGSLYYLGAILMGLAAAGTVFSLVQVQNNPAAGDFIPTAMVVAAAATVILFLMFGALGYGLSNLQPWARWIAVVVVALGLLNNLGRFALLLTTLGGKIPPVVLLVSAVVLLITGYILYLLLSPKSGVVFSRSYREVMTRTPHIKYKTSLILKIAVGLICGLIGFVIIAALFSPRG